MKRGIIRGLVAAGIGATLLFSMTGCSTRAPADYIILYYKDGNGDDRKFVECIEPGTAGKNPVDDKIFALPTSARDWEIADREGADQREPIVSGTLPKVVGGVSQPSPEVAVWATADFYLNTDCEGANNGAGSPVVQFWERTGRRSEIAGDGSEDFREDKWIKMLKKTLVVAEQTAFKSETRKYDPDVLDANTGGVWTQIERNMGRAFQAELKSKLGGNNYFCGPEFRRNASTNKVETVKWMEWVEDGKDKTGAVKYKEEEKSGKCPPVRISITDIGLADKAIAAARRDVYVAEQNAKEALVKAKSESAVAAEKAKLARDANYIKLLQAENDAKLAAACASNEKCVVVKGIQGNVNIPN